MMWPVNPSIDPKMFPRHIDALEFLTSGTITGKTAHDRQSKVKEHGLKSSRTDHILRGFHPVERDEVH
jgi:hypothetical protein